MERKDGMPWWVLIALSNFETRKGAMNLVYACAAFVVLFIPFPYITAAMPYFDEWTWFEAIEYSSMSLLMTAYYYKAVLWVDENSSWDDDTATDNSSIEPDPKEPGSTIDPSVEKAA